MCSMYIVHGFTVNIYMVKVTQTLETDLTQKYNSTEREEGRTNVSE
jgi:hypothetical protein